MFSLKYSTKEEVIHLCDKFDIYTVYSISINIEGIVTKNMLTLYEVIMFILQ